MMVSFSDGGNRSTQRIPLVT